MKVAQFSELSLLLFCPIFSVCCQDKGEKGGLKSHLLSTLFNYVDVSQDLFLRYM